MAKPQLGDYLFRQELTHLRRYSILILTLLRIMQHREKSTLVLSAGNIPSKEIINRQKPSCGEGRGIIRHGRPLPVQIIVESLALRHRNRFHQLLEAMNLQTGRRVYQGLKVLTNLPQNDP
jgi:hypothetical protein